MKERLILHIEFLIEEASAQAALQSLLPKILGEQITFDIRVYRGKPDLLKKLPDRLKGYKSWIPSDWRIVVLIDRDCEDCRDLKNKLEAISKNVGFVTKTSATQGEIFQVLNRIAIEELEAWFFGDIPAICAAYPNVSGNLGSKAVAKCIRTQKQQEQIPWHHVNCQNCVKVCELDASTKPNIFQCDWRISRQID